MVYRNSDRIRSMGSTSTSSLSATYNRCASLPILLLCLLLAANAERDFNANDSQVPVIEPQDAPAYKQDPYVTELMHCQHTQSEIVLSLLLRKHDWSDLTVAKRTHVQAKLSKFFAIPREFITLDSVGKRELSSMHKLAMRKGGKGQKHLEMLNRRLGRATFVIGCGANYFSMGEPIAKQIAHQIKDGTIGALTEENFGLWFIWSKELKSRSQRKRRQSEGSGVDEDDYDYEDEEDQPAEPITEVPATHAHRHHHGASEQSENAAELGALGVTATATPAVRLDEAIEESVSELESVISKTIENTKNIKELPVLNVEDDADDVEDVVELQQHLAIDEGVAVGVPAAPVIVESDNELGNELELSRAGHSPNLQLELQITTTATATASARGGSGSGSGSDSDSISLATVNVEDAAGNQVDTAHVAVDVAEHAATSTSQTTTNHNNINISNNNNNITPTTPSEPFAPVASSSFSQNPSASETVETSTGAASSTTSSSSGSATASGATTANGSVSGSSTANAIDTDLVNTLTTTTTATTSSFASSATTSSSSSSSTSSSLPPTTTTTSSATIPTTTATTTPTTTTTQSQTPKEAVDALEAVVNSSLPSLAGNEPTTPSTTTTTTTRQPELTSTTDASTDYVEPRQENIAPIIKMRLQKQAVTSGKAFSFVVPMDTFDDAEDQTNLRLELTDSNGHELKPTSWLQFNADKRELYGLPLDDAVSRWQYRLSATDSGNASVTETVEISVQQHRAVRTFNHEISIAVRIQEKLEHNIDWQLKLIDGVVRTLGDADSAAMVVREVRQTVQDPQHATFVYFNETLPTSECPVAELKNLVAMINVELLSDYVSPLLSIKSISGELLGACRNELQKMQKPTARNYPPMPRNQVDRVNASVGSLLVYKVPADTFYDPNDNELTLTLKTKENKELNPRNWMQFDSKNQEFYGIPKSGDIGTEEYLLIAEDSGGLSANDALVVVVSHTPKKDYAILFKAYLAIRSEHFNAELQRKFVERIAHLHGDESSNQIYVRSITPHHDSDGTIVNFYNVSLVKLHNRCPDKEMAAIRSVYLNSDLSPSASLKRALGTELNLTSFSVVPSGVCHHGDIGDIGHEHIPPRTKEPSLKPTFPEEYLATFILPAVIIVVMILLASIIACCLHRRRHKSGKMELGDEEERKSFRTKGIPVIFQDEYEEKPEIGNKSPVILKDEKPPLLPPSYNTSNMNGDNDVDEYVPPPAVVLGGREVRGKSPATPSYRKPPPYVSP
ncbi:hypothetical protein KR222_011272 [Zaprionus bogoriensis]|nr:hypothetical protein KR222_011272 [Zaprionus bogoriensis]